MIALFLLPAFISVFESSSSLGLQIQIILYNKQGKNEAENPPLLQTLILVIRGGSSAIDIYEEGLSQ